MGGINDLEWLKSIALFSLCISIVIGSTGLRIDDGAKVMMIRFAAMVAVLMGVFGLIQFIVANRMGFFWQPLPSSWLIRVTNPDSDFYRFAGLIRATGISYESSYYGAGMLVLTVLCITSFYCCAPTGMLDSTLRSVAVMAGLTGVLVSVSFAAVGVLLGIIGIVIAGEALMHRRVGGLALGALGVLCLAVFLALVWPYVSGRLSAVIEGRDNSFVYRVDASFALLAQPGDDLASSVFGIGLGEDQGSSRVIDVYTRHFGNAREVYLIVNGWAYVAVTMGWLGVALHVWLLSALLVGRGRTSRMAKALLGALLVGYFFINARYLSPEWWALFAASAIVLEYRSGFRRIPLGGVIF